MAIRNAAAEIEKQSLMSTIGNNINKHRTKAGFSQDVLAEKAGISSSYVTRIENGQKSASVYVLYKIAKALQVSCDALLASQPPANTEHIAQLFNGCSEEFIEKAERVIRTLIREYNS